MTSAAVTAASGSSSSGRTAARAAEPGWPAALLVPADPTRPVRLPQLVDTAAAFSAALGEVLFDAITADHGGRRYALYVRDDSGNPAAARPDNPRAAATSW